MQGVEEGTNNPACRVIELELQRQATKTVMIWVHMAMANGGQSWE